MLDLLREIVGIFVPIITLLLVIVFQYLRQRPILSFRVVRHRHIYHDEHKQLGIDVEIAVDNRGDRGTTIHDVKLLSATPNEIYELVKTCWIPPLEVDVPPHNTKRFNYALSSEKGIDFKSKVEEIQLELKISWTHGEKIMRITTQLD